MSKNKVLGVCFDKHCIDTNVEVTKLPIFGFGDDFMQALAYQLADS